ncbi:MAG: hypothetical protein HYR70_04445 [Chloroflexi bacterium]|nr:hypothetical protein [Chloroflexota bacterium]MBI3340806.1 hypothetical protein [Chloroflexota bacterium]
MKTPKNYRFSDETVQRIEWLEKLTNSGATQAIESAIAEKYESERARIRLKAVKTGRDRYDLIAGDVRLVTINQAVLDGTKGYKEKLLSQDGTNLDAIGTVFLATAMAKNAYADWNTSEKGLALLAPETEKQ